ncbi:hypothetical protein HPB49_012814 [Dermacentor silvarum]|uniref:Uncharacterized protein n=1 Tax=Dermacentor silvarum TaxID=543639 RepID=A0ACB8E0B3_DERSI|nr:hypothetical protein HPB49_012814 [Dermacentor silvarum]
MPAKDFKVVCRPKNWDLSVVTPRELGSAMRAAAKLTSATAAEEDLVRVNETNNTMTVSTPCIHRSGAYASVKTLKLGGRDLPVSAYVAAMENSVRGVIYNAYDGCPVEGIRAGFLKKNEGMEILDARPLGKSKAIQITFGGKPRKQPPGRQQSSEDKSQDGKEEQRSRPTERSSSGARDGNKSRDRSGSFPPLPGAGAGKAGGQGSSHERSANSANDTTKKVSWPNTGAPNETARDRELKRQVQQQGDTIKKMEARMADMERALKGGKGQGVLAPVMQAPQKVAQAAGSRVQESSAMEVENRGPVKRPPPADEGTNAKRVAETSTADTPQPAFKVTSLKADVSALVDRVGKLEDRQDRLEARVEKIEARLDKIEERFDAFTNESRTFQTQEKYGEVMPDLVTARYSIPLHNDLLRSDPDEPEERFFTEKMEPLNFSEIQYYGLMSVGNPPQTFKVIFDTTSNVTWVPSVGCSRTQCGNRKLYDNRKSSSYSPYGVWVEDPSIAGSGIKGTAARETIEFAGLKFTNQLFVEATVIDPEITHPQRSLCGYSIDLR